MPVAEIVLAWVVFAMQEPGPLVSTEWLATRLADPSVVVVQVEGRADRFASVHVPGARYLPDGAIAVAGDRDVGVELPTADSAQRVFRALGLDDATRIVIASHSVLSAARLWMTLDHLGHGDRASLLDGGLTRWRAGRQP